MIFAQRGHAGRPRQPADILDVVPGRLPRAVAARSQQRRGCPPKPWLPVPRPPPGIPGVTAPARCPLRRRRGAIDGRVGRSGAGATAPEMLTSHQLDGARLSTHSTVHNGAGASELVDAAPEVLEQVMKVILDRAAAARRPRAVRRRGRRHVDGWRRWTTFFKVWPDGAAGAPGQ